LLKIWRSLLFIMLMTASIAVFSGCGGKQADEAAVQLTISAAASLTDSLKEIKPLFESKNTRIVLNFNFGASGTLQQQIEQGAPSDVFISAGQKQLQTLVDEQLIEAGKYKSLLTNELVLITPANESVPIEKIEDISKADFKKIAVGQPETVPAGSYAQQSLTALNLWDALQSKLVFAKDVRQVLTYVETGNTDGGFVYKTDARTSSKVKVAFIVDPKTHKAIEYPAGIIKATKHANEAMLFYEFLQSKDAQNIFIKYGFSLPKAK
jgi:molybdate transport system substrate-binding protein